MMKRLEAAARQALEALDQIATHVGQYDLPGMPNHITTLATLHRDDLREALAEQQVAEPVGQKPYAYEYGVDNGDGTYSIQIDRGSLIHTGVQYEYCAPRNPHPEHPVKPLYTHPAPTQQPLTEEQIGAAIKDWMGLADPEDEPSVIEIARAIEAAHGITGSKT